MVSPVLQRIIEEPSRCHPSCLHRIHRYKIQCISVYVYTYTYTIIYHHISIYIDDHRCMICQLHTFSPPFFKNCISSERSCTGAFPAISPGSSWSSVSISGCALGLTKHHGINQTHHLTSVIISIFISSQTSVNNSKYVSPVRRATWK